MEETVNTKAWFTAVQTVAVLILLATDPAGANTYNVDRFDDTTIGACSQLVWDDCSLRGAIISANNHPGDDIVRLHTGTYTLTIAGQGEDLCQTGDLDVRDNLLILGDGPEMTVIGGAGIDRVIDVRTGDHLTVRGVTITGGNVSSGSGAGIKVQDGSLRLESCVVSGNGSATVSEGGAIYDEAYNTIDGVRIFDSWISGNTASNVSAIYTTSYLRLERSTVSGNRSTINGSAIWARGNSSDLLNSTVSNNTSATTLGGGLRVNPGDATVRNCTFAVDNGVELEPLGGSTITIQNTLVAGACAGTGFVSLGGNLESPGNTCGLGAADLINVVDSMLTGLDWYGGLAPVHQPRPGSPAVDEPLAGLTCSSVDQRGVSRPRDGGGSPAAICDIGAVEIAGAGELFVDGFECGFLTPWSGAAR